MFLLFCGWQRMTEWRENGASAKLSISALLGLLIQLFPVWAMVLLILHDFNRYMKEPLVM